MDNPAGIHLHRQIYHLTLHLRGQQLLLDLVSVLKELLNHVITEYIFHQYGGVGLDFSENLVLLIAVGRLKLLLDESRPMLVTAELDNVAVDVLQTDKY